MGVYLQRLGTIPAGSASQMNCPYESVFLESFCHTELNRDNL